MRAIVLALAMTVETVGVAVILMLLPFSETWLKKWKEHLVYLSKQIDFSEN